MIGPFRPQASELHIKGFGDVAEFFTIPDTLKGCIKLSWL